VQVTIGWILVFLGGALFCAQIISSINFQLAQRLGIQEKVEFTDPLLQRSERYTAYWDLVTLVWLPLAGILMIIDHEWWPIVSLLGGAIYFDISGREAVKYISFRHEGVRLGTEKQQKTFFATFIVMAVIGVFLIVYSINKLTSTL